MELIPVALFVAVIKKTIDFLKYLLAGDVNGIITQLVTWAVGIGLAFLVAHSDAASAYTLGGVTLDDLNVWAVILVGLAVTSTGSLTWDTLKTFDAANTSAMPRLVNRRPPAE